MKKGSKKKIFIIFIIISVFIGALGWFLYDEFHVVEVVPVSALKDDWWKDYSVSQATVTNNISQEVLPLLDKSLDDIYVEVGQSVKTGDPLLSFDVEEERIEMELAAADMEKVKLALNEAYEEKETHDTEELELQLKELEVRYETLKRQVEDAVILATIDGVVKEVNPTGGQENIPLLVIAGENQLYVKGFIDEFSYAQVETGSMIQAVSNKTGESFQAKITEISPYPASEGEYKLAQGQNPNMSWYPFSAVITDSYVEVETDETVNVVFDGISEHLYLPLAYVLGEGNESFIYVRNKENRLEKRSVTTGQALYQAVVEIKDGLTASDYVAFPYEKGIRAGAKTKVGDESQVSY